ncbi:hypothetical protein RUM43_005246 [Polyplax serrata]|uniref:IMD domain-containing protein n=1 Tax=Polyplax serrata TaxID=468196 RepID=A0AAN8XPK8_POLSC
MDRFRATVQAISAYLDSFQKIADAATNARGATKEIGTALTRICLRHKAVETRMKTLTSTIMDCLIMPLQEKLEDWKKIVINLDREHSKDFKKVRAELKKRSTDTLRLQKKARKGKCGELQRRVESSLQDITERRHFLEETEKKALRAALIEERSRFCVFVGYFRPVVGEEMGMLSELTHIQEIVEHLDKISADPHTLPPSSEQVIQDLKGPDGFWSFQSPPSSPSSLGSRKSSMCSISSLNSSSSGSGKCHNSPSHYRQNSTSQNGPLCSGALPRLSSISSQDSGFRSQDALFPKHLTSRLQVSDICEQSDNSNSSTPSTPYVDPNAIPTTTSTWPNLQETLQFERAASAILKERPHTISSAYERGHQRPSLTVYTFHAPEASLSQPASPVSTLTGVGASSRSTSPSTSLVNNTTPHVSPQTAHSRPPIPQRCSSLERPTIPTKANTSNSQSKTESGKTILSKVHIHLPSDLYQPPTYVNMSEIANLAASKAQEKSLNLPPPPPELAELSKERTDTGEKVETGSEIFMQSNVQVSYSTFSNQESHNEGGTPRSTLLRKGSVTGQKPPPPIRRTASVSSAARQSLAGNVESSGCTETLPPPPPSLLMELRETTHHGSHYSVIKKEQPQIEQHNISHMKSYTIPSGEVSSHVVKQPTIKVAETVRTLTELQHTPASPGVTRRSVSAVRSLSAERRDSAGSSLIAALSAKIAPNLSPRHSRRHSEDMIARNLSPGSLTALSGRLLHRGISSPGQNFLDSLNAKLAIQQQNQLKVHNAARVRQLFAGRTVSDPTVCHDSLMEQIKKGTSLKKTRTVNDRSAPKIH